MSKKDYFSHTCLIFVALLFAFVATGLNPLFYWLWYTPVDTLAFSQIMQFLLHGSSLGASFMPNEIAHMVDVRRVMIAFLLAGCAAVGWLLAIDAIPRASLKKVALGYLIGLPFFPVLFYVFHFIFFPQGNWQFPRSSMLIQLFPFYFFFVCTAAILLVSLGFLWTVNKLNKA